MLDLGPVGPACVSPGRAQPLRGKRTLGNLKKNQVPEGRHVHGLQAHNMSPLRDLMVIIGFPGFACPAGAALALGLHMPALPGLGQARKVQKIQIKARDLEEYILICKKLSDTNHKIILCGLCDLCV